MRLIILAGFMVCSYKPTKFIDQYMNGDFHHLFSNPHHYVFKLISYSIWHLFNFRSAIFYFVIRNIIFKLCTCVYSTLLTPYGIILCTYVNFFSGCLWKLYYNMSKRVNLKGGQFIMLYNPTQSSGSEISKLQAM